MITPGVVKICKLMKGSKCPGFFAGKLDPERFGCHFSANICFRMSPKEGVSSCFKMCPTFFDQWKCGDFKFEPLDIQPKMMSISKSLRGKNLEVGS